MLDDFAFIVNFGRLMCQNSGIIVTNQKIGKLFNFPPKIRDVNFFGTGAFFWNRDDLRGLLWNTIVKKTLGYHRNKSRPQTLLKMHISGKYKKYPSVCLTSNLLFCSNFWQKLWIFFSRINPQILVKTRRTWELIQPGNITQGWHRAFSVTQGCGTGETG